MQAKVKFLAAEALRGVGGLLLDNTGSRFVDELQHRDYVTGKMWENGKFPIRLVLNGDASKQIEWHCKHYVGRGLMKRYENGEALAKDWGIKPEVLKKTFDDYNKVSETKKDPFGKKFFSDSKWKMNDVFNVALMTPVLHYTMGGLAIDDTSRVLNKNQEVIPGLFAAGEVAGGVHGANRLGGSSLLGCVVFGRVSGDSAAAYLLQNSSSKATERLGAVAGHLLETRVRINPNDKQVTLTFSWEGDSSAPSASSSSSSSSSAPAPADSKPAKKGEPMVAGTEPEKREAETGGETGGKTTPSGGKGSSGSYSAADVAKHNKKDDCWVIINGQVLDVTNFLPDHPGGEKAILLYAGRDATEEFNMLHDPKVIQRYAPDTVIGDHKE